MIIFTLVFYHIAVNSIFCYNFSHIDYLVVIYNCLPFLLSDIMNKKAELAWELYLKMDTSAESFNLLQLIANACYKVGEFWYAAKAFDMLERMDPSPEHWEGKRGACCGTFQYIIGEKLPKYVLHIAYS